MDGISMVSGNKSGWFGKITALALVASLVLPVGAISASAADNDSEKVSSASTASEHTYDTGGDDYDISLYSSSVDVEYEDVSATYEPVEKYGLSASDKVTVPVVGATSESGAAVSAISGYEGYNGYAVYSDKTVGDITWNVNISKTGLYEISLDYLTVDTDKADIQRQIMIDGVSPFTESENIEFSREWQEASEPKLDINGDELTPKMLQVCEWQTCSVRDVDGMFDTNMRYLLSAGTHTITLAYVNSEMYVGAMSLTPASDYKSYAQVSSEYAANGYKEYTGDEAIRVEAESADLRSDQVLRRQSNSDPASTPYKRGHTVLNTIGGFNWRSGNQTIQYKITVPESGLYKLNMRVFQNHGEGLSVHRQITVDGVVPFAEVAAYAFGYSDKWQSETIGDENGDPYMFYLSAGEHTVGITVKMGQATEVINELYRINEDVTNLIRNITKITGSDPDLNFDYEIEKKYPELIDAMNDISNRYYEQIAYLESYCAKTPTLANSLKTAADQLSYLAAKPDKIPEKLSQMNDVQGSVSQWYFDIQDQPMQIDYLQFVSPDSNTKIKKASFWEKLAGTCVNFVSSFYKDYDSILYAVDEETTVQSDTVLDVWVARSKEMSEILQTMANEDFSVETGIGVKINILPSGSVGAVGSISPLMLAVISGNVPDIALGSDANTPVELAIRGATYDLSQFSDFDQVKSRFLSGALTPLEYNGGYYALPENMDFKLMFYRKDILSDMGIEIPQTWSDLYNRVLPILNQNGMKFYMVSDYATYLYQSGGTYYNADKSMTALDSNVAYQAFLQWTKNYTVYDMEETADIYNHFRMGDMPLVIGGYADYIKILYAAPDLYGKWDIAPVPGTYQEDGTLDRSAGGTVSTLMIFTDSKEKEGAWEFAKWWMDTDIQYNYSVEVEARMGLEARWNTANVDAFKQMSWGESHLKVFDIVFNNYVNMPNTLGGYYTARNVNNAWTRVVESNVNARTSWEKCIDEIENEMKRKRVEYGFDTEDE